jgi:hypothetical protein
MTQADSVHSTPPPNTSAIDDLQSPTKPPEKAQEALYLPTDVTPEEIFQAIGRLRKEARDENDRLIGFLDTTDDYMFRELEDAVDDNPCDDLELEPSLCGVTAAAANLPAEFRDDDLEGDDTPNGLSAEDEPALGSIEDHPNWYDGHRRRDRNQEHWASGNRDDREGDEHDGREPDVDDEPSLANTPREDAFGVMASGTDLEDEHDGEPDVDDEPSLGWPERMVQWISHGDCNDHEMTGGEL